MKNYVDPQISVIIPVYNAENYLWECLGSLCLQTFENFEVLCVNDGSSDSSSEIIRLYQGMDSRIKCYEQERKGAAAARNLAIPEAKGKYLLFLDADDFFAREMLEKSYLRAEAFQADVCVFKTKRFNVRTQKEECMTWVCDEKKAPPHEGVFSHRDNPTSFFAFTTSCPWNKLFRKSFILENGLRFQNIRTSNDIAFVMCALALAERITLLDECLLSYRYGMPTSLQATRGKEPLLIFEALRHSKDLLIRYGIYEEVRISFANSAIGNCVHNFKATDSMEKHKLVFDFLQSDGLKEFDIDCIDESNAENSYQFAEIKKIQNLTWEEYTRKTKMIPKELAIKNYKKELSHVYSSKTYRIGKAILYVPRKVREAYRWVFRKANTD